MQAVRITRFSPAAATSAAIGIRQQPFSSGRTEVVSIERVSPAPSIPAKRMTTALSVSVTSPRKPQQEETTAARSALRRSAGVGSAGADRGAATDSALQLIANQCMAGLRNKDCFALYITGECAGSQFAFRGSGRIKM